MKRILIPLMLVSSTAFAQRVIIVDESPEDPEPGKVEVASDQYRLRLSGLFEGTLGRDATGNMVGIPRARLRAEALVSTTLEVGFLAEVDVSPWSSTVLKEDGPGILRDVYARLSLGNKKLLDLGEARLGFFTMPVLAEQSTPQSEYLFLTGSLGREAWLPGRELAAGYEVGAYRYNIPVKAMLALGSGVDQRLRLGVIRSVGNDAAESAANVPLTAGNTGAQVTNPSLSLRVEGEPVLRWTRQVKVVLGMGGIVRPLSTGADARIATGVDAEMRWASVMIRATALLADTQRPPLFDSRAFMVEGALQVIPDFADVRVRYDSAYGPRGWEAHRIHIGTAFFYIDGVSQVPLSASPPPMGGVMFGRAFTLMWLRTYDLMRFSPARRGVVPPTSDVERSLIYWTDIGRWLTSGDTDQLVVRISF